MDAFIKSHTEKEVFMAQDHDIVEFCKYEHRQEWKATFPDFETNQQIRRRVNKYISQSFSQRIQEIGC